MRACFRTLAFAAGLGLAACSSSDDDAKKAPGPPVIDAVSLPTEVTPVSGNDYTITVSLRFHDDDGDIVNKARVQIPKGDGFDTTFATPGTAESKGVQFDLNITTTRKDSYDIIFTVFDDKGRESEPVTKSVVFK